MALAQHGGKRLSRYWTGVQRPFYRGELGPDAVEVFQFGDVAGWLIERKRA